MAGDADLIERWQAEERSQPEGWSFADLEGRMSADPLPWDFQALCVQAVGDLGDGGRLLDMGTGGGETLLELRDAVSVAGLPWPGSVTATEGWAPNVRVAREALEPAGVAVVEFGQPDGAAQPVPMPFDDGAFDLVLNRHESYHPLEIARVLAPGGVFLTQQVGGDEVGELRKLLDHPATNPHVRYETFRSALAEAGLEVVDGGEHVGRYVFEDVAAVVAYVQRVPWDVPEDFSVERYADQLLRLHRASAGGEVRLTMKRFWLTARRRT